ncbi:hypothetical protein [Serinibacter arcticus]|uniref:DUF3137 domain-containing protein n=1 Tax=Serinibacter arcticus TaxID=1655435 RepID=A0A4Z1E1T5_9MICO|nr:hypothetical protein [Serinibacter arcticus]TGO05925.1 hypothetical protein SERN_0117 [Serinibacter arcticus]
MVTSILLLLLVALAAVGLLALVIVLVVVGARRNRARVGELAGLAAARGWRFHPDGRGLEERFTGDPFGRGRRRTASQVLEGVHQGWPFIAFDYSYVTSSGNDGRDTTSWFSVVSLHLGARAPLLQVRPQSAFGRFFADSFGSDFRIGHAPFDDSFDVRTDSPEFALDVLGPQVAEMLLATRDRAWRWHGDSLLVFRPGRHAAAEIDGVLAQAAHLLGLVPPHVWARLRGGPSDAPL